MTQKEIQIAADNMMRFGGSFMQHLGRALRVADKENTEKILSTWEDDVKRYLKFEQ